MTSMTCTGCQWRKVILFVAVTVHVAIQLEEKKLVKTKTLTASKENERPITAQTVPSTSIQNWSNQIKKEVSAGLGSQWSHTISWGNEFGIVGSTESTRKWSP